MTRRTGKTLWLVALCSTLLLTVACTAQPQPAAKEAAATPAAKTAATPATPKAQTPPASQPPAAAKAPASRKLDVVQWGTPAFKADSGFLALGIEKGFFAEQGIEIQWINNVDATLLKGLIAREVTVGEFSPTGAIGAIEQGVGLKIIGATLPGIPHLLFAKSEIKSAKDLEGRSANITAPGGFYDILLTLYMLNNGADPNKLQKVAVGPSAPAVAALVGGKIDATPASMEFMAAIAGKPQFHVAATFAEALPKFLRFVLITRDDLIRQNPDLLQRFVYARSQTLRYAVEHRAETLAFTAKLLKEARVSEEMEATYDVIIKQKLVRPDLAITPEQVDYMMDARILTGVTKTKVPMDKVLDLRFQQQLVQKMGVWKW